MKIRKATKKDIDEVLELRLAFEKEQQGKWKGRDKKLNDIFEDTNSRLLKVLKKDLVAQIKSRRSAYFVAEDSGRLVAYLSISIRKGGEEQNLKKFGRLHYIFVRKEFRRQGIFTKLFKEAKRWFKDKGVGYWTLCVSAKNEEVHEIYKKLGFIDKEIEMIGRIK